MRELMVKNPFEFNKAEGRELDEAIQTIRKMMIRSVLERMSWWGRTKFRLYLAWRWIVKKVRPW
jgi:hypothetical protein